MTSYPSNVPYRSAWKDDDVLAISETAEKFFATQLIPRREEFEAAKRVDKDVWRKAGDLGLLCCSIPEEYGGGGGTFAHDLAVLEAQARLGDVSFGNGVHSGIVAHYILAYGTDEQKHRWLPRLASGEWVAAVAMTEPGAGSDLKNVRTRAVRDGDDYVVNGSKTFITNGQTADLIVTVAKTDPAAGAKGISLIVVEADQCSGFHRGRVLDKVGQPMADTSELSYEDARVPVANLLGGVEGQGFGQLMTQLAQERLIIGIVATAIMEAALETTVDYVKSRGAFEQTIWDFQNTKFTLADVSTEVHIARVFIDSCIERHLRGELDGATAAMVKWWMTEQQVKIVDRCVQFFGGYGYMREYLIARLYQDSRVTKIYGGANEVMKDLVARVL
ncbi:acyl-CoA dehydrogenase family protein [Nocardioides carbamazepini]|uniref:acyl-CoA dehydrogenase family protein n=1 Tax=Nocardioides carbamazepini TaxID=2854259 RepID=UPI00214A1532|nr:acyl-CoA dehydrogenase family protein [Nocardioides carbamazepini]MCR1784916.1 acyl-CoA dehydrogenase family protein [Nocardioides carbamazepini]